MFPAQRDSDKDKWLWKMTTPLAVPCNEGVTVGVPKQVKLD